LNTELGHPFNGSASRRSIESIMKNIELYFGSAEALNSSEKNVLERILRRLAEHGQAAIVICDISLRERQVDIVVGTETTTLQLEIKGYRAPVTGQQNGQWTLAAADGTTTLVKNGYQQALRNNHALRDAMSEHLPNDLPVSYPKGAVVFEPGIPQGSCLRIPPDPRVDICGIDALDRLLSTPGRDPWPLPWLRMLAHELNLIPHPVPDAPTARTPVQPSRPATWHVVPAPAAALAAVVPPALDTGRRQSDVVDERRGFTVAPRPSAEKKPVASDSEQRTPIAIDHARGHAPFGTGNAIESPPKQRRTLLRYVPLVCAAAAIAYLAAGHRHRPVAVATTPAPASQSGEQARRSPPKTPHGSRHAPVRQAAPELRAQAAPAFPSDMRTSVPGRSGDTPAPIATVAAPDTSAVTCPVGVDRLGCNGKTGTLAAPECPPAFHALGNTCIRDREN
jgi:hypothetical protein